MEAAAQKLGIEQASKCIALIAKTLKLGLIVSADGKIAASDLPHVFQYVQEAAVSIPDFSKVWPELQDLDSAEGVQLVALVGKELGILPEKSKKVILAALKVLPLALEIKEALQS